MRKRRWNRFMMLMICMLSLFLLPVKAAEADDADHQVTLKNSYLYHTDTGKRVTGYSGIKEYPAGSGNYYYFRSTGGRVYAGRWFTVNGSTYYAGADGILQSGFLTIDGSTYYMSPRTFARKTGWVKVSGKYYYFGKTGVQVTGFLQMPKYTYYLDPKQGGARKLSSWVVVNKKCYYVDAKGRVQKGFVTVGKKTYYMNSDGVRQKGLVTVNGKIYYMDRSTAAMRTGWVTYSGRTYYFQKTAARKGQAIVGWLKKDGAKYYFGSNGAMQTGWLTIGTQKYYLDPTTGKMTTGKRTIDGKTYDFGTKGYITIEPTGAWLIKVNQGTNVVTIYRGDTAVKALTCSVGLNGATPNGTFYIRDKLRWHELMGPSWGQYCSHITDDILFHSVPCNSYQDNRSMSASAYNKLGQAASHGCIRLNVASAKWIYDNCPIGTKVIVFTGTSADDPLGKPYIAKIPSTQTWDPTDPNL